MRSRVRTRVQISKQSNEIFQTNRALSFNEFYLYTDWSLGNHITLGIQTENKNLYRSQRREQAIKMRAMMAQFPLRAKEKSIENRRDKVQQSLSHRSFGIGIGIGIAGLQIMQRV